MNKIFKTTLVFVSLIAGFGYAEKARYDNEDEEMEYDNNPGEIKEEIKEEFKEEAHRIYRTFFEKRIYEIQMSMAYPTRIFFENEPEGDLMEVGIGIITSIPLSKDGPFKIESGIGFNYGLKKYGIMQDYYVIFRIPLLLNYFPLTLTIPLKDEYDRLIWMFNFRGGVFFDWKYGCKDEDYNKDYCIESYFFDSPGVIFTLGFRKHRDGEAKSFLDHLAPPEMGISYKNSNFGINMNLIYSF
jgi:hypothetical protein